MKLLTSPAILPVKGRQTAAEILLDRGRVMFHAPGLDEELLPESANSFVAANLGWRLSVTRDATGSATTVTVIRGDGVRIEAVRVIQK